MPRYLASVSTARRSTPRSRTIRTVSVLALCLVAILGCARVGAHSDFGFQASCASPQTPPDDYPDLDIDHSRDWSAGPHARFGELDLSRLALESLAWFQQSPDAGEWRDNPTASLELHFASDHMLVDACWAAKGGSSWEQQLRAWFECFPPQDAEDAEPGTEFYSWSLHFGENGHVHGVAESDTAALERLRARLACVERVPIFPRPSCSLSCAVRRCAHVSHSYGSDPVDPDELDELPRLVREKRTEYEQR